MKMTNFTNTSYMFQAIAFVLGGAQIKRQLRARSLQSIISDGATHAVVALTLSSTSMTGDTVLIKVERTLKGTKAKARMCTMPMQWQDVTDDELHQVRGS